MNFFWILIYNILFIPALFLYLPAAFIRRRMDVDALKEKLSMYPGEKRTLLKRMNRPVWIQAVSVGEIAVIKRLVERLEPLAGKNIVITTTTAAGRKMAVKNFPGFLVLYFPFDQVFFVRRTVNFLRPRLFISVETELWPSLYYFLRKDKVPLILINGRLSDKAFSMYNRFRYFSTRLVRMLDFIGVQDTFYRDKFLALGADDSKVSVTGSLKFSCLGSGKEDVDTFQRKHTGLKRENSILFIAASTHEPEEEIILDIFKELRTGVKTLDIIIAPRHVERVRGIERLISSKGYTPRRFSELGSRKLTDGDIVVLDTIGDLCNLYSMADICFVGGSLVDFGGHNILEPLFFSKATVFGPYMSNFREIERKVLAKKAAVRVETKDGLSGVLLKLVTNERERKELALRAADVFEADKHSLDKNIEIIKRRL